MLSFLPLISLAGLAIIVSSVYAHARNPLSPSQITAFIPFGDSYTDTFSPSNGGTAWPVYAVGYAGESVGLFPFARSGATCSNNITNRPFPSLFESQLPAWEQEKANGTLSYLEGSKGQERGQRDALYFLWIGTNDVGDNGLLTGHGAPGASLVDVVRCTVDWVNVVYKNGGRNFMFTNMIPLERTVLYSPNSYTNHYWTAVRNTTEWNVVMKELVLSGNELMKLMLQSLVPTLPGAHLGVFDAHGLFSDMLDRPAMYLNGTAPLNITGAVKSCAYQLNEPTSDTGDCTIVQGSDRDSFLWFDELHPSEQAGRIVAREVAKVITGQDSEWTNWLV